MSAARPRLDSSIIHEREAQELSQPSQPRVPAKPSQAHPQSGFNAQVKLRVVSDALASEPANVAQKQLPPRSKRYGARTFSKSASPLSSHDSLPKALTKAPNRSGKTHLTKEVGGVPVERTLANACGLSDTRATNAFRAGNCIASALKYPDRLQGGNLSVKINKKQSQTLELTKPGVKKEAVTGLVTFLKAKGMVQDKRVGYPHRIEGENLFEFFTACGIEAKGSPPQIRLSKSEYPHLPIADGQDLVITKIGGDGSSQPKPHGVSLSTASPTAPATQKKKKAHQQPSAAPHRNPPPPAPSRARGAKPPAPPARANQPSRDPRNVARAKLYQRRSTIEVQIGVRGAVAAYRTRVKDNDNDNDKQLRLSRRLSKQWKTSKKWRPETWKLLQFRVTVAIKNSSEPVTPKKLQRIVRREFLKTYPNNDF